MKKKFSNVLDILSEFLSQRKGLLPSIGLLFVIINAVLKFIPQAEWFSQTDIFLHLGVILAILGFLLAWAL